MRTRRKGRCTITSMPSTTTWNSSPTSLPCARSGPPRHDTVALPNGTVLIAVGDVAGHGIGAATGMVALRNALRGLAATGAGPAQLLAWLNNVAFHLTDNATATAICALYDPAHGSLRWASAGHLPPVLLTDQDAHQVGARPGVLLGALPDAAYDR